MNTPPVFGVDGLALPPVDAALNMAAANTASIVYGLLILILLVRAWFRPGEGRVVAAMMIGGAVTSIVEPLVDVITGVWHPIVGQDTVFTLAGRSIPLWVVTAYALFFGGIGSLMLTAFNRGVTRRGVWLWILVPFAFDPLIELLMLRSDLYYYIGNQPLVLAKFPLVQIPCNAAAVLIGVSLLYFLQPVLKGWRLFPAAALLMPFCAGMGWGGVSLPAFYAINSAWPNWAIQLCGILVFALGASVVQLVAQLVSVDSPWHRTLARHSVDYDAVPEAAFMSRQTSP